MSGTWTPEVRPNCFPELAKAITPGDGGFVMAAVCYVDSISSFPRSDCLNRWHTKRHGPSFMDRPSSSTRTDGQQDDAARSKWSSTESLPFAIAPNAASGSYGSRPGIQGNRVRLAVDMLQGILTPMLRFRDLRFRAGDIPTWVPVQNPPLARLRT